jgi:transposase
MNAYSKDLRLKVLAAIDRGLPRKEVQDLFGLSRSTIKRWLKRRRLTGDVAVHEIPGRPSVKGEALREWLPAQLKRNPDLTLKEHCEAFEDETGVDVSEATMSRSIARLPGGWPLKKVAHSLRTRRGGEGLVALAVLSLRREAPRVRGRVRDAHLDGSTTLSRSQGGASLRQSAQEQGQEPYADRLDEPFRDGGVDVPRGSHRRQGLRCLRGAFPGPFAHRGPGGGDGQSLGAHRPGRVRELIEARGAELVFLPSYSPDLNPIEQAFSKIKNVLRKLGARTHEALLEAMEEALSKVTPADAAGWFDHCGYPVEVRYL